MDSSESPFVFGRKATGENFTDREKETQHLVSNFRNRVNTVLISPRRWGKSSLVEKASELACSESLILVYLDAFGLRNASEFYSLLAASVVKATSGTIENWLSIAQRFFSRLTPKISFGIDPVNSFEIAFELESLEKNYLEILDLPEKIAIDKEIKIVICIDEFQNTAIFNESLVFHKRLRSAWQNHQHVTYCLFGSKQHMMLALFERQSMPFYKFGEMIHLDKIPIADWSAFIVERFNFTGKTISVSLAEQIASSVKCHSYYVQQLSYLVWLKTDHTVQGPEIQSAMDELLSQNAILYQRETEQLSSTQFNFLKTLASGINYGHSRNEILIQYSLGTSANVIKIKKALIEKELIDVIGKRFEFLDPAYELWFIKEFGIKNNE